MHSNQAVSGAQRGRRVRSWLLRVTTCAIAVAASATPAAVAVSARPARLVQPLTGDAGSVVGALANATFSGPSDDASALKLAVREVLRGPPGRRAIVLITTGPIPAGLESAVSGQLRAAD